ncbi:MAG: hypothetical protein U0361_19835 [Nitrospiraceae bacterium]
MNGKMRRVVVSCAVVAVVGVLSIPRLLFGADETRAKELIQQACVQCHRLEGGGITLTCRRRTSSGPAANIRGPG